MTTQMRHCVRAAQQGDKLAIEELLQTFKHFFRRQADEFKDYYPNREEALSTVTDLPESLMASENDDPEQHYSKEEIRWKTWRAIGRLPKQHRKIICLRYFHGYSYQDIAKECGMSKSSVRNYVNSGTEKLKIYLMEEGLAG